MADRSRRPPRYRALQGKCDRARHAQGPHKETIPFQPSKQIFEFTVWREAHPCAEVIDPEVSARRQSP